MRLRVLTAAVLLLAGCAQPEPAAAPKAVVFFESGRAITVTDGGGDVLSDDATVASAD